MTWFSGKRKTKEAKEGKKDKPKADRNEDDLLNDREKLLRVSATFLANPKVETETMELKRAFLKRKGLTEDEIKRAFELYKEKKKLEQEEKEMKEEIASFSSNGKTPQNMENQIERAKKSKFLSLKGFSLASLPEKVLELEEIETLILTDNPLGQIPEEIGKFKKLKILHVANCQIGDEGIPESLFTLDSLEELNIAQNHISDITRILMELKSLVRLNVADNDVINLDSVEFLPSNLKSLNLSNNHISEVPTLFGKHETLKTLRLRGNTVDESILEEIEKKGPSVLD